MRTIRAARSLFACLAFTGAACSFGPGHLEDGHLAYNAALKNASDDELLLNIVRLRYLDTIEFVAVNSISSQVSFSVALGGTFGTAVGEPAALVVPDASYSTTPTFTFTPQRGKEFADKIIAPVELRSILYLAQANWDADVLFHLLVQRINRLTNEMGATNSEFNEMARNLTVLQKRNELEVGLVERTEELSDPIEATQVSGADVVEAAQSGYRFRRQQGPDGQNEFVLIASRSQPVLYIERGSEEAAAVLRALGLRTEGDPYYELRAGTPVEGAGGSEDLIHIDTRSLLDAIVYVRQGVEVPAEHLEEELTYREDAPRVREFFHVRSSRDRPDAELAIQYRGYWFHIADTDVESRTTFLVLAELVRLQLSPGKAGQAPVLTLPVGQ